MKIFNKNDFEKYDKKKLNELNKQFINNNDIIYIEDFLPNNLFKSINKYLKINYPKNKMKNHNLVGSNNINQYRKGIYIDLNLIKKTNKFQEIKSNIESIINSIIKKCNNKSTRQIHFNIYNL